MKPLAPFVYPDFTQESACRSVSCNGGSYKRVSRSVVGRLAVEKGISEEPFGTDEPLVEVLKAGEQLAQLILVKRYGPRMKYLIKSISWESTTWSPDGVCWAGRFGARHSRETCRAVGKTARRTFRHGEDLRIFTDLCVARSYLGAVPGEARGILSHSRHKEVPSVPALKTCYCRRPTRRDHNLGR